MNFLGNSSELYSYVIVGGTDFFLYQEEICVFRVCVCVCV